MEVSEDIQRELIYGLNAVLLQAHPRVPDAAAFTHALQGLMRTEGPRFHEPDLWGVWAAEAGHEPEELREVVEEAVEVILEELEDDEEPWSAHRVLDLLAEERFWTLRWGGSGGALPVPPRRAEGLPLPLPLRPALVSVFDQLEVQLYEAHQDQRSVHDQLPQALVDQVLSAAIDAVERLGRAHARRGAPRDLPHALVLAREEASERRPPLRTALEIIQRWKLSVQFDAAPDEDDGEWTMRVLERLYRLEWVAPPPSEGPG